MVEHEPANQLAREREAREQYESVSAAEQQPEPPAADDQPGHEGQHSCDWDQEQDRQPDAQPRPRGELASLQRGSVEPGRREDEKQSEQNEADKRLEPAEQERAEARSARRIAAVGGAGHGRAAPDHGVLAARRSEEHTSELQ